MSDYLSPEQQDPEQRIRELERGLGDTSHPNPHQSTPFPEQAVAASAGSMPTWAPSPVRSGYPSAPMWRPGSGVQRSRRWVAVLLGVVLPLGMAIAVTVPWKDLGLLDGVFGPTTTRTVRDYQRGVRVAPNGIVGRSTWKALQRGRR